LRDEKESVSRSGHVCEGLERVDGVGVVTVATTLSTGDYY
jgi:hypothetical protein